MTDRPPPRLATHTCKHCGAVLALIDERTRYQRFALRCAECGAHLVLRPSITPIYSVERVSCEPAS